MYIVCRGVLTPYLMKTHPPYVAYSLFEILFNPPIPPTSLSLSNPNPTVLSVVLFLWLNGWSRHILCAILLNDNIDLHMFNLVTLVPDKPWCVFYVTRHHVHWSLTHKWFFTFLLMWHTSTHQHTQVPVDRHINVYLHCLLCAHNSYLITLNDYMNNSLISKIYFPLGKVS